MNHFPPDPCYILVVFVPQPRDLEIVRLLGWYRIPLRSAPKIIQVDHLAFYQPASFGAENRWKIVHHAELLGVELVRRVDLFRDEADHPRAQEEYYKMQVGPLRTLDRAIEAGSYRRLTFLYTTGALFRSAQTVSDLVVAAEERESLWLALREKALQGNQYHTSDALDLELPPDFLAMLGALGGIGEESADYSPPSW